MITLYPKKSFTFTETKPEDEIYEMRLRLKNVRGALASVAIVLTDAEISIETGSLFYDSEARETGFWTMFINLSNANKKLADIENDLKKMDVVLDVAVKKLESPAFDVMHFPLLHGNSKAIVLPIGVFRALWTGFESILLPPGLAAVLYNAGKKVGEKVANTFTEKYGLPRNRLVAVIMDACQATGWGVFEVEQIDYERCEATLIVRDCFEANAWQKRPYKTCHWTRGYFAGMMSKVFNEPVEAVETKCAAMGDEYCEFRLQKKL